MIKQILRIFLSEFLNHHDTKDRVTRFFGGKLGEYFSDKCVPYTVAYAGYCHSSNVENEERNNHEEADTLIVRECIFFVCFFVVFYAFFLRYETSQRG